MVSLHFVVDKYTSFLKKGKAAKSEGKLRELFPRFLTESQMVILIFKVDNETYPGNVICDYTHNLTNTLRRRLVDEYEDPSFVSGFASYWSMVDAGYDTGAKQFVSEDETAMIIQISVRGSNDAKSSKYARVLKRVLKEVDTEPDFKLERSGSDLIMQDFYSTSLQEILVTDSISAVFALIVLLILINRLTLMVIPLCNLLVTVFVTFAAMYFMALNSSLATFVPAIVVAVLIAMTIDYSLFLLVRFRQELQKLGRDFTEEEYRKAVTVTLEFAGKVIAVSGATLAITFMGLAITRIGYLVTLGWSSAIGLLVAILSNISLGPSILMCFPRFFSIPGIIPCWEKSVEYCSRGGEFGVTDDKKEVMEKSVWFKVVRMLTIPEGAVLIIVLVLAAMFPIMYGLRDFGYTIDNNLVFNNNMPGMAAIKDMTGVFPPGYLYPFYVVGYPSNSSSNMSTFSKEYFKLSTQLAKDIKSDVGGVDDDGIISMSYTYGNEIPYTMARSLIGPLKNTTYGKQYNILYNMLQRPDGAGSIMMLLVNFDPNGGLTEGWFGDMQKLLDAHSGPENGGFSWVITNVLGDTIGACEEAFHVFPVMVGVTISVIAVLLALAFRSIAVPLRLIVTIGLTVTWTYGLASLVFCDGALDWIFGEPKKIYWIVPPVVFSIIVGLGIDYDVFLFSRITEYRAKGHTTVEAIRYGYYHTGSVITGAGVVMAIAFSGLTISKQQVLQHLGFFLSTSVLLDTFVIRMLLVPSILYFLDRINWWPSKLYKKSYGSRNNANAVAGAEERGECGGGDGDSDEGDMSSSSSSTSSFNDFDISVSASINNNSSEKGETKKGKILELDDHPVLEEREEGNGDDEKEPLLK